jgi:DNA-binding LacI/PurR family transcriptional regulator
LNLNFYDIAKKAGVSTATVSRVLNGSKSVSEKTRKRVSDIMAKEGYTPNIFARGLMVNSMKTIGVLTIDVRDLYYARSIHAVESEARKSGYNVILCNTGDDIAEKKKYLKLLLQKRVDGIILIGSVFKERTDNSHITDAAGEVPVVLINGALDGENICSITCDDRKAVFSAVKYLAGMGHRSIVYIYDAETFSGMEKLAGFKDAIRELGLDPKDNLVLHTVSGMDGGTEAVRRLLEQKTDFTAILAAEDILAAGALKALADAGIGVPGEVSVIGYNNSVLSQCTTPGLTSIDNKVDSISASAVSLLIDAINGRVPPRRTVVEAELIRRQSVGEKRLP